MSLAANALTTPQTVSVELGVPGDAETLFRVERLINAASEVIETHCGRRFAKATLTEKVRGFGSQRLMLERTPVLTLTSITLDGQVVDPSLYELEDADRGFVRHKEGWWEWTADFGGLASPAQLAGTERPLYAVAYTGGYVLPKDDGVSGAVRSLPAAIEEAAIITAVVMHRRRAADSSINAYAGETLNTAIGRGSGGIIPDVAVAMLAPYRRVR